MYKFRVLQLSVFLGAFVSLIAAGSIFTKALNPVAKTSPMPTGKIVNVTWITLDTEPQFTWLPGPISKVEASVPRSYWLQHGERSSLSFNCPQAKFGRYTSPSPSGPEG